MLINIYDNRPKDMSLILKGSGLDRTTDKPHVSHIIRYLESALGVAKYAKDWELDLAAEAGFLWEDVLSLCLVDRQSMRPGEIELDGVIGSPDGIAFNDELGGLVLDEYKCTWMSTKKTPDKVWKWMTQVKSYLHMLELDTVVMYIFHINGDYRGSGPVLRRAELQFGQDELEKNWDMIINHKEEAYYEH